MKTAKLILLAGALALASYVAYANCSTQTYYVNGRVLTCTTCCYGNNCTTNCF